MKTFLKIARLALAVCAALPSIARAGGQNGPVGYAYMSSLCGPAGGCLLNAPTITIGGYMLAKAIDCNFDTATPQNLPNTDGGVATICAYPDGGGISWPRVAVNFSTGSDRVDGGLLLQCTNTGGSGLPSVCDGIYTSLAAAIPNFSGATPLLIEVFENNLAPGNTTAKYQEVAVDNFPLASNTGIVESTSLFYRQMSGWVTQDFPSGVSTGFNDVTIGTGYNVLIIWYPGGIGASWHEYGLATYDGGLPSLGGDVPLTVVTMNGTTPAYEMGPANHFNLFFNCVGGATTTAIFDRVVVYARP